MQKGHEENGAGDFKKVKVKVESEKQLFLRETKRWNLHNEGLCSSRVALYSAYPVPWNSHTIPLPSRAFQKSIE